MRYVVLAIALLAVAGCRRSTPGGAGDKPRTRVQLNWVPEPEFGGIYAARESGAYARAGINVEIVGGAAGTPVLQIVGSGQADFGVVGADDVVLARARGVDVVAVFASFQHSPLGVMTHAKKGYEKLDELKSGTLAIEPGLPFGAWIKKKYTFAGVTLVPYDGGIARFLADPNYAQQCYVTSEPIEARKKGADPKVFSARETGFDPYANVLIVRGELLRSNRALVRTFVTATAEGWRSYLANPAQANGAMAKLNVAMDRATFDEVAKVQEPLVRGEVGDTALGTMSAARFSELGAQLVELGTIPTAPKAEECFAAP
jgi:NitT/TauT family transport system substrate-binding protein